MWAGLQRHAWQLLPGYFGLSESEITDNTLIFLPVPECLLVVKVFVGRAEGRDLTA